MPSALHQPCPVRETGCLGSPHRQKELKDRALGRAKRAAQVDVFAEHEITAGAARLLLQDCARRGRKREQAEGLSVKLTQKAISGLSLPSGSRRHFAGRKDTVIERPFSTTPALEIG